MKKILLILISLHLCIAINAGENYPASGQETVYVVMSPNAYAYHRTTNCDGVRKAKHPIKQVSIDDATNKMKRRPCKLCYGSK